jgi:hypothetical protein
MVGARLSGTRYHFLPPAGGGGYFGGGDGVDAQLTALELDLGEHGSWTITWAMEGELEGLSLLGKDESYSGLADETVAAGDRDAWRDHLGQAIMSVAGSWQVSGKTCPESLWALRLDFATGSVVVALGAVDQGIDYMPDELVVVFNPALADSYRPNQARQSAWRGQPVN